MLHSERANSLLRSQKYEDCLQDCAVAIYAQVSEQAIEQSDKTIT